MAQFKYIGDENLPPGTPVTVRIGKPGMAWYYEFTNVVPNETILEVSHPRAIEIMQVAKTREGLARYQAV